MTTLKFGLIGCGDFGPMLGRYFRDNPRSKLTALCDPNIESMRRCAQRLELDVPEFEDAEDLIASGDIDAVAIASPNDTHAPIAIAAARAGKHIFCEKAMAATLQQCWEMAEAAEENNVCLMVGHKRRLRPPWAKMTQLAHSGELGKPLAINVTGFHLDPTNVGWWRRKNSCGGLLHRAGIHPIDWMRAVLGDAAWAVAVAGPQRLPEVDYPVIMAATYGFKSGAIATIQVALTYPLWKFREAFGPQIVCERGGIRMFPYLDHIDVQWQSSDAREPKAIRFDDLGFDHAYRLETGSFIEWVLDGKPPVLTWREGLRCVEMMEAAYISAERGGEKVTLPLMPEREGRLG